MSTAPALVRFKVAVDQFEEALYRMALATEDAIRAMHPLWVALAKPWFGSQWYDAGPPPVRFHGQWSSDQWWAAS